MDKIEKINPPLKGVLPKIYADPDLNKQRLGTMISRRVGVSRRSFVA